MKLMDEIELTKIQDNVDKFAIHIKELIAENKILRLEVIELRKEVADGDRIIKNLKDKLGV